MKVSYICLLLFVVGIGAQRKSLNPDAIDSSTSPRTRGRGRAKFTLSTDTLETEVDHQVPARATNRRRSESRTAERKVSRPVQQPLENKPYEVKELFDDVPLKNNKKPLPVNEENFSESSEYASLVSPSSVSSPFLDENKEDHLSDVGDIAKDVSLPQDDLGFIKNEILSSSENPDDLNTGFPQNINDQLPPETASDIIPSSVKVENNDKGVQPIPRRKVTRKKQRIDRSEAESRNLPRQRPVEERTDYFRSRNQFISQDSTARDTATQFGTSSEEQDLKKTKTSRQSHPLPSPSGRKERILSTDSRGLVSEGTETQTQHRGSSNFDLSERNKERRTVDSTIPTRGGTSERRRLTSEANQQNLRLESHSRNNARSRSTVKQPQLEESTVVQKPRGRARASPIASETSTVRSRTRERGRSRSDTNSATVSSIGKDSSSRTKAGRTISDSVTNNVRRSKSTTNVNTEIVTAGPSFAPLEIQKGNSNELSKSEDVFTVVEKTRRNGEQVAQASDSVGTVDKNRNVRVRKSRRQRIDNTVNPNTERSRSRSSTQKLEVLPLFESESKPIPTNTLNPSTPRPNKNVEETEKKRKEKSEIATTVRSRVTRRQVSREENSKESNTATEDTSLSKKATQPTVKKSVQVSEVVQVTTTRKIGRKRKNSRKGESGDKSTTEKSENARQLSKPSKSRKSSEKSKSDLGKSDEELNESDNYPEPFKSLIKAKKQTRKSSKSKTTEQAKVTEKLQIVTPYTTPVTSSATTASSLASPLDHVYFRRGEDKETELKDSKKQKSQRLQTQKSDVNLTDKIIKQAETPVKEMANVTTDAPKTFTKSSQRKTGRYHARFKSSSTTSIPSENEIISSTKSSSLQSRSFSPKPTGAFSSKKFERSTVKPSLSRSSLKTFSKANRTNKDFKVSTTQTSPPSKSSQSYRFSSRYRNDPLKRSSKLFFSTPGPKYIPTIPTVTGMPITDSPNFDVLEYQWSSNRIS